MSSFQNQIMYKNRVGVDIYPIYIKWCNFILLVFLMLLVHFLTEKSFFFLAQDGTRFSYYNAHHYSDALLIRMVTPFNVTTELEGVSNDLYL